MFVSILYCQLFFHSSFFKEGSIEEFLLVHVWLGCIYQSAKSVNISLGSVQYQINYKQHKYIIGSYSVEHKTRQHGS